MLLPFQIHVQRIPAIAHFKGLVDFIPHCNFNIARDAYCYYTELKEKASEDYMLTWVSLKVAQEFHDYTTSYQIELKISDLSDSVRF